MKWALIENQSYSYLLLWIVGVLVWESIRNQKKLNEWISKEMQQKIIPSFSFKRKWVKKVGIVVGYLLIILALLGPQYGKIKEISYAKARQTVLVIDVSMSMQSKDVLPSRLEYAKKESEDYINLAEGDPIGIVVFAGEAVLQCPVTTDKGALKLFLDEISVNSISTQGTDLAKAIKQATEAIVKNRQIGPKAMIILTDGESFESDPLVEVKEAQRHRIQVVTVGIGTPKGEIIPIYSENKENIGYKKSKEGKVVVSKLNETLLKEIAKEGKGAYISATQYGALSKVYEFISKEKTGVNKRNEETRSKERYQWFLLPAFIVLFWELLYSERKKNT